MPPLLLEPNVFPEDLFQDGVAGQSVDRTWWVLHTKPRQEKRLARDLLHASVPFYLPLVSRRSLVRGRVMEAYVPLFGGYLFLLGHRDERLRALTTGRVVNSLAVPDQTRLWHDLSQVHRLITSGSPVTPEDGLEPGDPVRVVRGPLSGLQGRVLRRASGNRFMVQVDFIHRGASVLLEDFHLAAVETIAGPAGEGRGAGSPPR